MDREPEDKAQRYGTIGSIIVMAIALVITVLVTAYG